MEKSACGIPRDRWVVVYHLASPGPIESMRRMDRGQARTFQEARVALVFPSSHPLVQRKLVTLRATQTGPAEFRHLVRTLACLLAQEATADLPTRPVEVATPLGTAAGHVVAETVGIVPIL